MTETEWEATNLLDVLGDALCRQILVVGTGSPVSATTLADRLDVSPPTVYRRIDSLVDHELVREHRRVDADGNHYRAFETTVDRLEVVVTEGGYHVDVHLRQDLADQFDGFWTEFTESSPPGLSGQSGRSPETDSERDPSPL